MHYVHKKARCDPEIATFRMKISISSRFTFKLAGKTDLRGSRGPWSSILLFATGVSGEGSHLLTVPKYLIFTDLILKTISSLTSDLKKLI